MKAGKIIGYASEVCWWQGHIGEIVPIVDEYEQTGYIKIRIIRYEKGFEDQPFPVEGWIPPEFIEEV